MSTALWTDSERLAILTVAEEVFFRAMLDGYVGGENQKSTKVTTADGHKVITYIEFPFRVVDEYWVTPQSDCSSGTTTILFNYLLLGVEVETPVWWMSYGGEYPKAVIPFLKQALTTAYRRGEFRGGRGPEGYFTEEYSYRNNLEQESGFSSFQGYEEISSGGDDLGFHRYFGQSLI